MTDAEQARALLETMAFQEMASTAVAGTSHGSRLARLKPGAWQAGILRHSAGVVEASDGVSLRRAMQHPGDAVIFLPQEAMVTAGIIERICAESGLAKFIVWETDEA